MELTEEEKNFLRFIVKQHLEDFKAEEKTLITEDNPVFVKSEAETEEFLKNLLEKL